MGLDYAYSLRFRRNQLAEILLAVADIAKPLPYPPLEVVLPGGTGNIFLPFTSRFKAEPVFCDVQDHLMFATALWFESDDVLERYANACDAEGHPLVRDDKGRISFGYVYLFIFLKIHKNNDNSEYLDFHFTPATSQMSLLFAASESVRRSFVQILRDHDGLLGQFMDSDNNWGPITIWPETSPLYNPTNLLDLHNKLSPETPYYRLPLGF